MSRSSPTDSPLGPIIMGHDRMQWDSAESDLAEFYATLLSYSLILSHYDSTRPSFKTMSKTSNRLGSLIISRNNLKERGNRKFPSSRSRPNSSIPCITWNIYLPRHGQHDSVRLEIDLLLAPKDDFLRVGTNLLAFLLSPCRFLSTQ